MECECWEQALARAVTDVGFRARLLANPGEVLREYGADADDLLSLVIPVRLSTLGQAAGVFARRTPDQWHDGQPDAAGSATLGLDDFDPIDSVDMRGSGGARRRSCARRQGVCKDARLLPPLAIVPRGAEGYGEASTHFGDA